MANSTLKMISSCCGIVVLLQTLWFPTVMSAGEPVLTISGSANDKEYVTRFDNDTFLNFFQCLCNTNNKFCVARGSDATQIDYSEGGGHMPFNCTRQLTDIVCGRGNYPVHLPSNLSKHVSTTEGQCKQVTVFRNMLQDMNIISLSLNIGIYFCTANCINIAINSHEILPLPSTNPSRRQNEEDESDTTTFIIGAAVGGGILVLIIIIIAIICIKRRKAHSASTNNNGNNEGDNTDIYPYGESSMNNIKLNSTGASTDVSMKPPLDAYTTVDPINKLNKRKTSGTNNANNNSKENKSRFNQNMDYTEVDMGNGQEVSVSGAVSPPPLPPDLSAKPGYYNVNSETGEAYAEVTKKNQNKNGSAASEEGAGSSPARDPTGYEEAVPRTDTKCTTVDFSTKNTSQPASDGVYAKLHDPVRNITDVYNEWPAQEKAGQ